MIAKIQNDSTTLEGLRANVLGEVILPGDAAYGSETLPFNVAVVPQAEVVVGATCAEDVVAAVRFATANGLPVGVQASGHGIVSTFAGGVLVTTSRMRKVEVDVESRRARVEPGVRWGDVIEKAAPHGLAPLSGSTPLVGVVGYTLGGGLPLLGRKFGYAADLVRSVELVTADGEVTTASPEENPDLFWAIRGGKGNFGIVTALEFDLVELPEFYAGALVYPGAKAAEVLRGYQEWTKTLPDEMGTSIAFMRFPPMPEIPEPLQGQFVVWLRVAYAGDAESGAALLRPMRDLGPDVMDTVGSIPFTESGIVHMDPTDPMPITDLTFSLSSFSDETVDACLAALGTESDSQLLLVELRLMGGALNRAPERPSAVGNRNAALNLYAVTPLVPGMEEKITQDMAALKQAMQPFATGTASLNFLGIEDAEKNTVSRAFEPETFARLLEVKAAYDPENVFRLNHNIR